MNAVRDILLRRPLAAFFVLACGISWTVWLPAVWAHLQQGAGLEEGALLLFLGGFGPFAAALILSATSDGTVGVKALLKRLVQWRVDFAWYVVALYGFPALGLLTMVISAVASPQEVLSQGPTVLVAIPAYALTSFLVLGPLGEELGWRGYALPRLQVGCTALAASVILGLMWALWHAPLVLLPEWRNDLPVAPFLVLYPLYIIALTIIFTWVYNGAAGSVLITMVLHASFNYTIFFLNRTFGLSRYGPLAVQAVGVGVLWLVAGVLIAASGPKLGLKRPAPL